MDYRLDLERWRDHLYVKTKDGEWLPCTCRVNPHWIGGRGWHWFRDRFAQLPDGTVHVIDDATWERLVEDGRVRTEPEHRAKRAAHQLHVELARHRIRDHYAFASEVLGKPVRHLSHLTPEERNHVRLALDDPKGSPRPVLKEPTWLELSA